MLRARSAMQEKKCGYPADLVSCPLAPLVLHQLQHKEDEWQDARANRIMQFKVSDFKDSRHSQSGLAVERYLAALPTLKQGVIAGVFKIKGPLLGLLQGREVASIGVPSQ